MRQYLFFYPGTLWVPFYMTGHKCLKVCYPYLPLTATFYNLLLSMRFTIKRGQYLIWVKLPGSCEQLEVICKDIRDDSQWCNVIFWNVVKSFLFHYPFLIQQLWEMTIYRKKIPPMMDTQSTNCYVKKTYGTTFCTRSTLYGLLIIKECS